jgi:hypothetical protein
MATARHEGRERDEGTAIEKLLRVLHYEDEDARETQEAGQGA